MRSFIAGNYPTIRDEYRAFVSYLRQNGINTALAAGSYEYVRKRILKTTEAPQS